MNTQQPNIVITCLQVWDLEIGTTIKNLALEMSKHSRVLYINTPMDHSTWLRGDKRKASYKRRLDVIKGREPYLRQINENLWVADCPFMVYSISQIKNKILFDFLNKLNNKRIARFIAKITKELGLTNYVHFIDTDIYRSYYLKEMINPALSIYYRRDYVIGEPYWKNHGARLEQLLAAKSDLVLANSLLFAQELGQYNQNSYYVATGVNLELYNSDKEYAIPADMQDIAHPIVGYVGTINSMRLDSNLLLEMAKARPHYNFVFTGPEDDFFKSHKLHDQPNVYFLGNKKVEELSSYVAYYDVCINPQIINNMTIGNYPLKVDEYLAMGKPTVATRTRTMEQIFSEHTHLANGLDEYLDAIDLAMSETGDSAKSEARIAFAHTHSWAASVGKMYHQIENALKDR